MRSLYLCAYRKTAGRFIGHISSLCDMVITSSFFLTVGTHKNRPVVAP